MKFCPECGTKVEGMKFCPECGYKLTDSITNNQNGDLNKQSQIQNFTSEQTIIEFSTYMFGLEGKKTNIGGNMDLSIPQDFYTLTNERLIVEHKKMIRGKKEEFELYKIKDISVKQSIKDKMLGVGDIIIFTVDESTPQFTMKRIKNPEEIKEAIRKAVRDNKKALGIQYRQEL